MFSEYLASKGSCMILHVCIYVNHRYHVVSYHIISYHIILYYIILYYIKSYHIMYINWLPVFCSDDRAGNCEAYSQNAR